jgi:hypothetical protein
MMASIESGGVVHFRAVPPGSYHAVVECEERVLSEGPSVVNVGKDNIDDIIWKVDPGLGLVVHMIDGAGSPLPGALVLLTMATRSAQVPLTAGVDGTYEYPSELFPGSYRLRPTSARGGYDGEPVDVVLRAGMGKVEATVRFAGEGSIIASVYGSDSKPIDDVDVIATRLSPAGQLASAGLASETDAAPTAAPGGVADRPDRSYRGVPLGSGRFRLGPLASGRYKVQAVDGVNPPFEAASPSGPIVEVTRGVAEATILVDRGASIRGLVVDKSNQPVPDTWVTAMCEAGPGSEATPLRFPAATGPFRGKRTMSDKDGRFTVGGLRVSGLCAVRADEPYGLTGTKADVRPGDEVIVALTDPAKPTGRVSQEDGQGGRPAAGSNQR